LGKASRRAMLTDHGTKLRPTIFYSACSHRCMLAVCLLESMHACIPARGQSAHDAPPPHLRTCLIASLLACLLACMSPGLPPLSSITIWCHLLPPAFLRVWCSNDRNRHSRPRLQCDVRWRCRQPADCHCHHQQLCSPTWPQRGSPRRLGINPPTPARLDEDQLSTMRCERCILWLLVHATTHACSSRPCASRGVHALGWSCALATQPVPSLSLSVSPPIVHPRHPPPQPTPGALIAHLHPLRATQGAATGTT
jgi:hypothetical protein